MTTLPYPCDRCPAATSCHRNGWLRRKCERMIDFDLRPPPDYATFERREKETGRVTYLQGREIKSQNRNRG